MSFQRLFPSFPVPFGHFTPAGKPPPPPVLLDWLYPGGMTDIGTPDYQNRNFAPDGYVGEIVTPTIKWTFTATASPNPSAIGDIDADGKLEVVCAEGSNILCLNDDGTFRWRTALLNPANIPMLYDIDGDGKLEILVNDNTNYIYCLNPDGTERWSYAGIGTNYGNPVCADIDGDGALEIVTRGGTSITILNIDGTLKLTINVAYAQRCSVSVSDVDGDGVLEIFVGCANTNQARAYKPDGTLVWTATLLSGSVDDSWMSTEDLDKDGILDTTTGIYYGDHYYRIRGTDGVVTGDIDFANIACRYGASAIKDIDGDGVIEACQHDLGYGMHCVNGETWTIEWSLVAVGTEVQPFFGGIIDIDGDGELEVLCRDNGNPLRCIDKTGVEEWRFEPGGVCSWMSFADIDYDGKIEIIVGFNGTVMNIHCVDA